jgi:hypothetical protein
LRQPVYKSVSIHFLNINFRQYPADYKLQTYLKIARLYLEDEDPIQAEAYINRASLLQADSKNEELQIHYKVIYIFISVPYSINGWLSD